MEGGQVKVLSECVVKRFVSYALIKLMMITRLTYSTRLCLLDELNYNRVL